MKLIFERGKEGQGSALLPECDVPEFHLDVPKREKELHLPHVSENELSRHYTELAKQVHGGKRRILSSWLLYHEI